MFLDYGFVQLSFVLLGAILIYKFIKIVTRSRSVKSVDSGYRSQKNIRPLDMFESTYELFQERDGTMNICLVLSLKSKKKLPKEYVYDALVLLTKRQPMLRAVISPRSTHKYFEVINVDDDIIDFTTSGVKARRWKDMWYQFISSPHGSGLLWRAVLLQEEYLADTEVYLNTLVFKICHACIDGVSCMKLCKQFLCYLNNVANGTLTREAKIESLDLMPGLYDILLQQNPWPVWQKCLCFPQIWKIFLKTMARLCFGSFTPKYPYERFLPTFSSNNEEKQRIITEVFSEEKTVKFVRACRSNGCTVTGALMAIVHIAFCRLLDEEKLPVPVQIENHLAINGQRNCQVKPPEEYLGQYYLGRNFFMPFAKKGVDFWKFAEETTTTIHSDLKHEMHIKQDFAGMNLFNAEEICQKFAFVSSPDKILLPCNTISNAGSFNFGKEQHYMYDVHECLVNAQIEKFPGLFRHFITTVNDKLSWVVTFNGSRIGEEKLQQFVNHCFSSFSEII